MPNQKLLEIIGSLSEKKRQRLSLFVESGYHNDRFNRAKLIKLCETLVAHAKEGTLADLEKAQLSTIFFPDHTYTEKDKNPIDSLASDLFSLTRDFLLVEGVLTQKDRREEQLHLARFYREHNLQNRFLSIVKQFRKQQSKVKFIDEDYYYFQFKIEEEVAIFQSIYNTYADDSNLIAANQALDNFYAILKAEFATHFQYQKILASLEADEVLLLSDYLFEILPQYEDLQNPLTELYRLIFGLLVQPDDEELFHEFVAAIEAYEDQISPKKFRNIAAYQRNISGRRIQLQVKGSALFKQLFPMYRDHLEKGYFHVQATRQILPASLKVLTNLAIKADELDWALRLLKTYSPTRITGTKYPVEAHSLCAAEVYFHQGDLKTAQEKLVYRNFENINYSILADILLLKIYYVTKDDLLTSRAAALSQKIRRSKITAVHKKQYLNFLTIIGKIEKLRWNGTPQKVANLRAKLEQLSPLIEREWLLKVLNEQ